MCMVRTHVLQSLRPVAQLSDHQLWYSDPVIIANVCGSVGLSDGLSGVKELCAPVREKGRV